MALSDSYEQLLLAVAEVLPEPVFILDKDGRYIESLGGLDVSRYDPPHNQKGKTVHGVLPSAKADWCLEVIRKTIAAGTLQIVEYALDPHEVDEPLIDPPVPTDQLYDVG